jgi:DNA replication protein DnaD
MPDMKFTLPWQDAVVVSGKAVEKLVNAGDGDAALLYLYILRTRGADSVERTAAALSRPPEAIAASMARLNRLGLVMYDTRDEPAPPPARADELPEYSSEDIRRGMSADNSFRDLVHEVQKALGKLLSSDDLTRLYGIYDSLGLPAEVILHLVNYCIMCLRERDGASRMPTMRYIEKAAYSWERAGVFSLERAEALIKEIEARRNATTEIRSVLRLGDRDLSASEQRYVDSWMSMGFSADAVGIAFDRTMLNTGKLAWKYMDSIINNWHGKGLHTSEEITRGDVKRRPPSPSPYRRGAASPPSDRDDRLLVERLLGDA